MDTTQMGWLTAIIVGGLAGWLAEKFMKSNQSLLMNILLGIIGAVFANFLLSLVGIAMGGIIGYLVAGIMGASLLIALGRMIPEKPSITEFNIIKTGEQP